MDTGLTKAEIATAPDRRNPKLSINEAKFQLLCSREAVKGLAEIVSDSDLNGVNPDSLSCLLYTIEFRLKHCETLLESYDSDLREQERVSLTEVYMAQRQRQHEEHEAAHEKFMRDTFGKKQPSDTEVQSQAAKTSVQAA